MGKFNFPKIDYKCLGRSFIWIISNTAIGLAPLLFLIIISPVLNTHKETTEEITTLLKGGMVLFVCCALMGAVIIDIMIEKIYFNKLAFFALNVFPFIILSIICFLYLLKLFGHVSPTIFTSVSGFYIFVTSFTFIYCTLGKYFLYLKSEQKNRITV
jgi:hypothetical protein